MTTAEPTAPLTPPAGADGTWRRRLGLTLPTVPQTVRWTGLTVALLAIHAGLGLWLQRPPSTDFLRGFAASVPTWTLVLVVAVLVPIFEEVVFRGALQGALGLSALGGAGAVVLASAAWTALHLQYDAFDLAFVFALGLVFGTARWRTGSLLLAIGLHALVNALGLAAFLLRQS